MALTLPSLLPRRKGPLRPKRRAERTLVVEEEAQMRLALDGGHDTVTGLGASSAEMA